MSGAVREGPVFDGVGSQFLQRHGKGESYLRRDVNGRSFEPEAVVAFPTKASSARSTLSRKSAPFQFRSIKTPWARTNAINRASKVARMSGESPPARNVAAGAGRSANATTKCPSLSGSTIRSRNRQFPLAWIKSFSLPDHRLGGEHRLQSGARRGTQRLPDQTEEVKARRSRRWAEVRLSLAGEHEHVMVAIGDHIGGQVFSMARRAVFSTLLSLSSGFAAGATSGAAGGVTNGIPGNAVASSE